MSMTWFVVLTKGGGESSDLPSAATLSTMQQGENSNSQVLTSSYDLRQDRARTSTGKLLDQQKGNVEESEPDERGQQGVATRGHGVGHGRHASTTLVGNVSKKGKQRS